MTYTKQVREYCETYKGTLIDISKVKDEEFADIPYKTLFKQRIILFRTHRHPGRFF